MSSLLNSIFGPAKAAATQETASLFAKKQPTTTTPLVSSRRPIPNANETVEEKALVANKEENDDSRNQEDEVMSKASDEKPPKAVPEQEEPSESNPEDNKEATSVQEDKTADDRTVFCGNLPLSTTRKDLARLFRPCGKVASTRIRSVATLQGDAGGVKLPPAQAGNQGLVQQILVNQKKIDPSSSKASVQGYVVFSEAASVEEAIKLNNSLVSPKGGEGESRRMRVDRVNNQEYDARRSVFLGNLPWAADEEGLRACFVKACPGWTDDDIQGIRIVRERETQRCKGFGYVLLRDSSLVATALRTMNGQDYKGRPLRAMVCGKRFKTKGTGSSEQAGTTTRKAPPRVQPVAVALRQMVTDAKGRQQTTNKRKRGKKTTVKSTGKSKRAASEAKTNQRVKKIEKRIRKGMGKSKVA
jgi:RNA recognition motif-containing protein